MSLRSWLWLDMDCSQRWCPVLRTLPDSIFRMHFFGSSSSFLMLIHTTVTEDGPLQYCIAKHSKQKHTRIQNTSHQEEEDDEEDEEDCKDLGARRRLTFCIRLNHSEYCNQPHSVHSQCLLLACDAPACLRMMMQCTWKALGPNIYPRTYLFIYRWHQTTGGECARDMTMWRRQMGQQQQQ